MQSVEELAGVTLSHYRESFKAALAAGLKKPLVLPYDFIPGFFIPMLYMTIPHTKRPWLYQARWLVLAFAVLFNLHMVSVTSSTNIAISYASGLWGLWSIIHNFAMLVWMRPQFDAERVARRPRRSDDGSNDGPSKGQHSTGVDTNGHPNGRAPPRQRLTSHRPQKDLRAPEVTMAPGCDTDKYEYYWQCFPEDGPFSERFVWALELYGTFRGTGWNWAVPVVPNPKLPERACSGELVKMDTVPLRTRSGYSTYRTPGDFLRTKLLACLFAYLSVDCLKVFIVQDPYFFLGRDSHVPLPPHLSSLSPRVLWVMRNIMFLHAAYAVILGMFSAHDIFQYYFMGYFLPMRAELWTYSSIFGSFDAVLDRGLAGFWGATWHQTFRIAFAGPATWLLEQGHLRPRSAIGTAVTMIFAFSQSSLLHCGGSYTTMPQTKVWYPALFFMLSAIGVIIQQIVCITLRPQITKLPLWLRRVGNLIYVVSWLHWTVWPLADDFSAGGIWLLEPAPLSLARALRLGQADNAIWRIDSDSCPGWHSGKYWWQSGISL